MKLIEQWGSGIPRVIEDCKGYGLREPDLIELGMSFRVNIYRPSEEQNEVVPIQRKKRLKLRWF